MKKSEIPTPALVIDLDAMEFNIEYMAQFFAKGPTKLRPHFKTHKCAELARKQIEAGAIGLTCAKLGEAEVLVEAGIGDILIANQIVSPAKIERLAQMQKKSRVMVAVDNEDNLRMHAAAAQRAGTTIPLVVEVNVGLNRCGVEPGEPALSLARLATQLPGLEFAGLLGYEGHTVLVKDPVARRLNTLEAMGKLVRTADRVRAAGLEVPLVSAGGTGTFFLTGTFPGVTEVEAGSYLFMDTEYRQLGLPFRNSLYLLATVISVPAAQRAVIDAGMKVLSTDNGLPEVHAPQGLSLRALHEEHGILEFDPNQDRPKVGSLVELIPSHVCTTVNLHDRYYGLRGEDVEKVLEIQGRGRSQ